MFTERLIGIVVLVLCLTGPAGAACLGCLVPPAPVGSTPWADMLTQVDTASLETKTMIFCMRYETIKSASIYSYAKEIDASGFPMIDILTTPACNPRKIGGDNKITIAQLTVESPFSRLEHITKLHNYIMKRHKDEGLFIAAVNALNTAGMTTLDYIHFVIDNGDFTSDDGKAQVYKIREFVCAHGGVYVKFPDQSCH